MCIQGEIGSYQLVHTYVNTILSRLVLALEGPHDTQYTPYTQ